MKGKRFLLVVLICGLFITLFSPAATAAPMPSPSSAPPDPECNPVARKLSEWMGVGCSVLMSYQEDGVGFGVIMKAYFLSTLFPGLQWRRLVEGHTGGLGWGQIMKAYYLAKLLDLKAKDLLEKREEGMGWGQILQEHREGPGKPPWAGQGPPPWAHRGKPPWAGPHKPKE